MFKKRVQLSGFFQIGDVNKTKFCYFVKGIVSRDSAAFFWFNKADIKFVIGSASQVYISFNDFPRILILPVWISVNELNTRQNHLPQVDSSSMRLYFPAESHSSGGFLVPVLVVPRGINIHEVGSLLHELVIPGGEIILPVDSSSVVIPSRITIYPL
jgi:hypothetical protein